MSYRTHNGQTMLDVMLQNKGELRGLIEFFHEITSITEVYDQSRELSITKELTPSVDNLDRKGVVVVSDAVVSETIIKLIDHDDAQLIDDDTDELITV